MTSVLLPSLVTRYTTLASWYDLSLSVRIRVRFADCLQLMHPILDDLDQSEHDWIKKLLFTFNEGNIGKFEALAPLFPKEVRDLPLVQFLILMEISNSPFFMRTIRSYVKRSA
jgi:hypothetical protein